MLRHYNIFADGICANYQRICTIYSSWYHYYHLSLVHNSAEWYLHTIKDRQIYRLLPHLCHKVWRRTIFWCNKLHILRSGVLYCRTHIVWFILMTQKISTVWWYYDNMYNVLLTISRRLLKTLIPFCLHNFVFFFDRCKTCTQSTNHIIYKGEHKLAYTCEIDFFVWLWVF